MGLLQSFYLFYLLAPRQLKGYEYVFLSVHAIFLRHLRVHQPGFNRIYDVGYKCPGLTGVLCYDKRGKAKAISTTF